MVLRCTYGSTNCNVTCKVVFGTDWYDRRLNHYAVQTVDGSFTSFDLGPTMVYGTIVMKDVSVTDASSLRTFIKDTIVFTKRSFSISQFSSGSTPFATGLGVDLGLNPGVTITSVKYIKTDTEGVFNFVAPGKYDVNFPIVYRRS